MSRDIVKRMHIGITPATVQQVLATLIGPIIGDAHLAKNGFKFPKDDQQTFAGEAIIGRHDSSVIKLVVEPAEGGYSGTCLEHDEVNAIGVNQVEMKE